MEEIVTPPYSLANIESSSKLSLAKSGSGDDGSEPKLETSTITQVGQSNQSAPETQEQKQQELELELDLPDHVNPNLSTLFL